MKKKVSFKNPICDKNDVTITLYLLCMQFKITVLHLLVLG